MKLENLLLILVLVAGVLAGCGGETPAPTAEGEAVAVNVVVDESDEYVSAALDTSYEGALPASSQLALGTLRLEGTEGAVTPEQAAALLPLWQAIQGGGLQSNTEINSVLKQIERQMTSEQLTAIAAMQLTVEEMRTWVQEQGVAIEFSPEALATRQAEGGGQGGFGPPGNLSEEERASIRATMEAGGMPFGDRGNLSEEERAARRATAEAGGMSFGGRGFRGGVGQIGFLAQSLIELLTQRAAE
ncbi:MAG: hypothetical protein JSV36_16180 [Anaerolineae bacterium]|nr:MAG: hypothetical protein JSV36_16180 [Anaerolineae bacterium]